MKYQRILFTAPNVAELVEQEAKAPGAGEVAVRLMVSSISSGTERANLTGDVNVSPYAVDPVAHFPRSGGYSSSGVVESVGEGVTAAQPGDRVALSWSNHSQYIVMKESLVYKLPDGISFEDAALLHIGTFPMAAIRKTHFEIGEPALVMGQGVLGQIAVMLLRAAGAAPVIAADPNPARREKALRTGADFALDPLAPDFTAKVKELTSGGARVVIEVTGNGHALDQALDCTARFGRVALLGCTRHSDFTIDYYRKVHAPGITLVGAHTNARPEHESSSGWWTQHDDVMALLRLQTLGRISLGSLVEDTRSPEEASEVYGRLAVSPSFPITQFDWRRMK